jgi:hypothetical protein
MISSRELMDSELLTKGGMIMRKREWLVLTGFALGTLLAGLVISRAYNPLWDFWYTHQEWSWLWTILNF